MLTVHLIVGLLVSAGLLLVSVSGAILVFRSELEAALVPAVPPQAGRRLSLQSLVDAARRRHPGATPAMLLLPDGDGQPARVRMIASPREALDVSLDPFDGRVLASRWQQRSPLHALELLHTQLYMGPRGSLVVGAIGLGLLLQAATGLVLWWPFARQPGRGLTLRWTGRWRVLNHDIHKTVGFLSLAFNVPLALTGTILVLATLLPARDTSRSPAPRAGRHLSVTVDEVAQAANAALPAGRITAINLTRSGEGIVIVRKRLPGHLNPRGEGVVTVDGQAARVLSVSDGRKGPWARRLWRLVGPLHFGDFAGLASKIVYFVGGVTSSVLVVSGFLIWLSRARAR